ncbi:MAG: hypothetical protein WAO71_03470 [Gallionella sp.]
MKTQNKPRGLASIRSMSNLVTETTHPHRKFLKLAILAMEKARRGKEKASAQRRIEHIDERLAEIRTESDGILLVCNEIAGLNDAMECPESEPVKVQRGFALKY